jgi:hypothetical protein
LSHNVAAHIPAHAAVVVIGLKIDTGAPAVCQSGATGASATDAAMAGGASSSAAAAVVDVGRKVNAAAGHAIGEPGIARAGAGGAVLVLAADVIAAPAVVGVIVCVDAVTATADAARTTRGAVRTAEADTANAHMVWRALQATRAAIVRII